MPHAVIESHEGHHGTVGHSHEGNGEAGAVVAGGAVGGYRVLLPISPSTCYGMREQELRVFLILCHAMR